MDDKLGYFEKAKVSNDSSEIANLFGAYPLNCFNKETIELQEGLYRDDASLSLATTNRS